MRVRAMTGYAGPGFLGVYATCRRIAAARYPDRWVETRLPENEATVWSSFFDPRSRLESLELALTTDVSPRSDDLAPRLGDYCEALGAIRDALVAEQITAFFRDDQGVVREIDAVGWGSDNGERALSSGRAWLDEGADEVCRYILLRESEVAGLCGPETESDSSNEHKLAPRRGESVVPNVAKWLKETFPEGVPEGLDRPSILAKINADGVKASLKSLERALKRTREDKLRP